VSSILGIAVTVLGPNPILEYKNSEISRKGFKLEYESLNYQNEVSELIDTTIAKLKELENVENTDENEECEREKKALKLTLVHLNHHLIIYNNTHICNVVQLLEKLLPYIYTFTVISNLPLFSFTLF
jgi:hypothetical protein